MESCRYTNQWNEMPDECQKTFFSLRRDKIS
jgi:hypothetical protein